MKAIVRSVYGTADVLQLSEVPRPVPGPGEVLVRVHAVSLNGSDKEALVGKPLYVRMGGLRRPRHPILGSDVAGRVESVGEGVESFEPGDEVFGELPDYRGGLAEFACAPERLLARKPPDLSHAEAAALPQAGCIAYRGILSKGGVQPGQQVLINGAGGGAGTFAVQLAKMRGAEVTAVDSADKHGLLRSLGAEHVIDYRTEDFARNGKRYDLILDLIASRAPHALIGALAPRGTYLYVGGAIAVLFQTLALGWAIRLATGKTIRLLVVPQNREDLLSVVELYEAAKVAPIIDRLYSFDEAREAVRRVAEGRHLGKVVIRVADDASS